MLLYWHSKYCSIVAKHITSTSSDLSINIVQFSLSIMEKNCWTSIKSIIRPLLFKLFSIRKRKQLLKCILYKQIVFFSTREVKRKCTMHATAFWSLRVMHATSNEQLTCLWKNKEIFELYINRNKIRKLLRRDVYVSLGLWVEQKMKWMILTLIQHVSVWNKWLNNGFEMLDLNIRFILRQSHSHRCTYTLFTLLMNLIAKITLLQSLS
jgi:hypothetical protein